MTKAHHVHGLECCVRNVPESLMFVDTSFEITIHRSYTPYALDTLWYIHQKTERKMCNTVIARSDTGQSRYTKISTRANQDRTYMQGCHTCTDHGSTLFLPQLHAHHALGQQTTHFWGQSSCGAVCGAWRSFNGDLRHEKRGGPTKWAEAVALVLTRRLQRPHVPRQRHLLAFESLNPTEVDAC